MSNQVPKCRKRVFNCLECDEREDCKDWFIILEDERARSEELLAQMPELVDLFGFCAFKIGKKDDWIKELAKMSFGC